jgi:Lrp/AsnC family transcriptional regulator for asnA, asnC and gidA
LEKKDGRMAYRHCCDIKISNTMVHQRINRLWSKELLQNKAYHKQKKIGYDWGAFTGITLNKDEDSSRIIEELKKIPEVTECYYITGSYTLYIK